MTLAPFGKDCTRPPEAFGKYDPFTATEDTLTILLSEFNQHAYNAYYNFWVQMATGPLLRDIYGHRQYRFYSEQSGCDFYGLLVSDCEKTDRRYFPESALQRRDIQK